MLKRMSAIQLQRWRAFGEIESFGEMRQDLRIASVVQALCNLNRDPAKYPDPFPLSDFVITFSESDGEVKRDPGQTWQEKKAIALLIAGLHSK
jgi:hypothetical protein